MLILLYCTSIFITQEEEKTNNIVILLFEKMYNIYRIIPILCKFYFAANFSTVAGC